MASATAPKDPLEELLKPAFGGGAFSVYRTRPLTFVCGGNNSNEVRALRHQFLDCVTAKPLRIVPVLAERAFAHQLVEKNLQKFEQFLASTAECVLIFVESPGSFAETGLFANMTEVIKKTYIVNTREKAKENSFLNIGPIKLIRKRSDFDTVYELESKTVTPVEADEIVEKIVSTCPKYKNALVFHPQERFAELGVLLQLGCVYLVVSLMWAADSNLVTRALRAHFKGVDREIVERLLSLLKGISLLDREDETYFNPHVTEFENDELISSVSFAVQGIRGKTLEWQQQNSSQVTSFLRNRRGIDI